MQNEKFYWGGFAFPLLPTLDYQPDGPDRENPDRLFIADKKDRFRFYFEKNEEGISVEFPNDPDYEILEVVQGKKHLCLSYPMQKKERKKATGYFRIEIRDDSNHVDVCAGSLSISPPEPFFDGLRKYTDLYILFRGLCVCREQEGKHYEK